MRLRDSTSPSVSDLHLFLPNFLNLLPEIRKVSASWSAQASTLAWAVRIKALPMLHTLGTSWTAATDHAAEHLSALQQLLRARYQSHVQHAVQS